MERTPIIGQEYIKEIGAHNFDSYKAQAEVSCVPISFFRTSRALLSQLDPQVTRGDVATLLFGYPLESDDIAWAAIKYAEAVSIIKDIKEAYGEEPSVDGDEIDSVVGMAVIIEKEKGEEIEIAKEHVEDFFSDPRNVLNFFYFSQILQRSLIE